MREKRIYILIIVITLLSTTITFAEDFIAQPVGRIDTDGDGMVWASYVGGNWQIFYADLRSGNQVQITDGDSNVAYPAIWQNKIVWQEYKNGKFEIILYNLNDKTRTEISTLEGNNIEPIIRENHIVWANQKDGYKDLVVYDMNIKTEQVVTQDNLVSGIDFDGEYAVWMDGRNGNLDIYAYDIARDMEVRVTSDMADDINPKVSEGEVIYTTHYGGTTHLHKYDISLQEDSKLTAGDEEHKLLAFSGGQIVMTKGENVILKNANSTVETDIETVNKEIPRGAFLNGTDIVWLTNTGMQSDNINDAVERVEKDEDIPTIKVPNEKTSSSKKSIKLKESSFAVLFGKDNVFELEDTSLKILIESEDILSEGEIRFEELDMNIQDGDYSLKSKVYELKIHQGVTISDTVTLVVSYGDFENSSDLSVYNIEDTPRALKFERHPEQRIISVKIQDGMKIALMSYDKEFSDIPGHWAKETIESVASQQLIKGYGDGTIRPNNTITRAEFMKILVNYFTEGEVTGGEGFIDIKGHWAEQDLMIAKEKGWLKGFEGKALPNNKITREEMTTILLRISSQVIEEKDIDIEDFADYSQVSEWSKESINRAIKEGIIQGDNKNIKPKANATRAEAITIIYRFLDNRGNM